LNRVVDWATKAATATKRAVGNKMTAGKRAGQAVGKAAGKAMPQTKAALQQRKGQLQTAKTAVKAGAKKVASGAMKEADRRIANRIQDPTGAKTMAKNLRKVAELRGKAGQRPTSRRTKSK